MVLAATAISTGRKLLRGEVGVDLIAVLAMAGALVLSEYLAGAIIALMLTGGAALGRFAVARARRELSALIKRAPLVAHRRTGADIVDIDVNEVALGDLLLVKPGEVVPVDGIVGTASAVLDESALTGESKPVQLEPGVPVGSGGTNAGGQFEIRATASAAVPTRGSFVWCKLLNGRRVCERLRAIDGVLAGVLLLQYPVRPEAPRGLSAPVENSRLMAFLRRSLP